MSRTHLAAVLAEKGKPLVVQERATPEPGPNEYLVQIKVVALNPVDYYQRDHGMPPVPSYPAVLGIDNTGFVAKVGSQVKSPLPIGAKVISYATSFWSNGSPDHGSFQQYALAPAEAVIALPESLSFEQGAILPLATTTALTAWTSVGIPLDKKYKPEEKQAVLIWGGASSVGTLAIQSARSMGFTVFATASSKNHEYLKTLGANALFDYKSPTVAAEIVQAVKSAGLRLETAHVVTDGGLQATLDVLKDTKGSAAAKVAHSPVLPDGHPTLDDTEIKFVMPPLDKETLNKHLYQILHGWLADGLKSGTIVPSPKIQVEGEGKGIGGVNAGLDVLKAGVSATKIVVPIS